MSTPITGLRLNNAEVESCVLHQLRQPSPPVLFLLLFLFFASHSLTCVSEMLATEKPQWVQTKKGPRAACAV